LYYHVDLKNHPEHGNLSKIREVATMEFAELTNEQRRQSVDAKQLFDLWRTTDRDFRRSYRGSMRWRTVKGKQYLYRIVGKVEKSLGARSPETEKIKDDYTAQRTRTRQRSTRLQERLKAQDRLNRAYGLGRMPTTAARVLRELDEAGLLGTKLFLVGTHSLYAYEARCGVLLGGGLTATRDVDLLLDTRQHMSLAIAEGVPADGVLGILRRADKSFSRSQEFRATNDDGYFVDLIAPFRRNEAMVKQQQLGNSEDDIWAASIIGLQWLINAPKFEEIVIGEDGRPLWVSCIDPRAFALHKLWVSKRPEREPEKRRRDAEQARAVANLATKYLDMNFAAKDLTALPIELVRTVKDLVATISRKRS
jgi:hypothetical protein